jgi:hypothetical protein
LCEVVLSIRYKFVDYCPGFAELDLLLYGVFLAISLILFLTLLNIASLLVPTVNEITAWRLFDEQWGERDKFLLLLISKQLLVPGSQGECLLCLAVWLALLVLKTVSFVFLSPGAPQSLICREFDRPPSALYFGS